MKLVQHSFVACHMLFRCNFSGLNVSLRKLERISYSILSRASFRASFHRFILQHCPKISYKRFKIPRYYRTHSPTISFFPHFAYVLYIYVDVFVFMICQFLLVIFSWISVGRTTFKDRKWLKWTFLLTIFSFIKTPCELNLDSTESSQRDS